MTHRLVQFYGVQGSQRGQLLALAEATKRAGGKHTRQLDRGAFGVYRPGGWATSILEWQINVVPGLLQAEQYAREVLSGYQEAATISPRAIERRAETRPIRQQLLLVTPLEYVAFLDESVLHRQRGDRSVLYA